MEASGALEAEVAVALSVVASEVSEEDPSVAVELEEDSDILITSMQ